jgi:GH18 family chitinase
MDLSGYTHIHFAFAKLTPSFTVDVSFMQQQFDRFKTMKSHKRVISFGGWVDSTATDKFWIFREAVKPGNRDRVINNLVSFVTQNGLDRLDIDWEYPAAPDIPDIPSADPLEGQAYLEFLKILRSRLPSAVSLSIATPAGFWYLQGFPVVEVSKVVDYIVYMTCEFHSILSLEPKVLTRRHGKDDFHGQWDYGRKHSIVGCQSGDCLRSHINMTETMSALVLITKAGVPSHKIIVGVSSYGRSFKMLYPGCTGDKCPFTGPKSGAKPGVCTGEPGYLANAEINRIIADKSRNPSTWYDAKTMTNYLVYDDIQWVAYMDDANKADRTRRYRGLNFGGTTDWAVDLQRFGDSEMRYLTDDALAATEANDGTCPWRNTDGFHCDQVNAVDTAMDGGRRWKMAACDCAWVEFMKTWELRKSSTSQTFSNSMAEFFKLGEGLWECEDVSDGCYNMQAYCQDTQTSNQTGPAAPLIAKSFASVQRVRFHHIILHFFEKGPFAHLVGSSLVPDIA